MYWTSQSRDVLNQSEQRCIEPVRAELYWTSQNGTSVPAPVCPSAQWSSEKQLLWTRLSVCMCESLFYVNVCVWWKGWQEHGEILWEKDGGDAWVHVSGKSCQLKLFPMRWFRHMCVCVCANISEVVYWIFVFSGLGKGTTPTIRVFVFNLLRGRLDRDPVM